MTRFVAGERLTVDLLTAVAERRAEVVVPDDLVTRLDAAYEAAQAISAQRQIYGRSTGVGANRLTHVAFDPATHGMNLIRSHAVDAGDALPVEAVRAAIAVRLNQLAQGGSGIEPDVVVALGRMLQCDGLPDLREFGSIGTGDLSALAGIALALVGERPTRVPLDPLAAIRSDSALPFISSSALTIGEAALALARFKALLLAQRAIFALSVVAIQANPEAFAVRVAQATGLDDAPAVARQLATLLHGTDWEPARIQDPYAFRCFLEAHAVLASSVRRLEACVVRLMNLAQENPLFDVDEGRAYHHGGFYQAGLAHELDCAALALAQNVPLLLSRLRFIDDEAVSGLPRFLAPHGGGTSGTMIVEYVAASAMGEVMAASAPVSMHAAVISCGVEEDATFASTAVRKLGRALHGFEVMLAAELLVAVRAMRLRSDAKVASSRALGKLLDLAEALPKGMDDRDLRQDVEIAQGLLAPIAGLVRSCADAPDSGA